jgi:ketosteroid isomerase-like protein
MKESLDVINSYFDLVQSFDTNPATYAAVLHPEIEQIEYPNLINKITQYRSFEDIVNNLRVGRELLRDPSFEVHNTQIYADGSVLVEGVWQATAVSDTGALLRGQRLTSHLCLIFEFKDGKIYRQRRYACFEQL